MIEKRAKKKFEFNKQMKKEAFLYRCYSKGCAKWAFNLVDIFIEWICEVLDIKNPAMKKYWSIK